MYKLAQIIQKNILHVMLTIIKSCISKWSSAAYFNHHKINIEFTFDTNRIITLVTHSPLQLPLYSSCELSKKFILVMLELV